MRIKGEIEPRMPQGNNAKLSDAAIAKIERWVKEGAALDAGHDPAKPISSYAASADQVRRAEVARMPAAERDKKTQEVGLARFKQANASLKPEVVPSEHFLFFSNLPKDRATNTLKVLETQYGHLRRVLGSPAPTGPKKSASTPSQPARTTSSSSARLRHALTSTAKNPPAPAFRYPSRTWLLSTLREAGKTSPAPPVPAAGASRAAAAARKRSRKSRRPTAISREFLPSQSGRAAVSLRGQRPALAGRRHRRLSRRPGRAPQPLLPPAPSNGACQLPARLAHPRQ